MMEMKRNEMIEIRKRAGRRRGKERTNHSSSVTQNIVKKQREEARLVYD
jgi:hypothetical protein